ncbi:MAG: M16 family metallopeptidase [Candidatus Zixiibacteriota bacterium]
MFRKLLFLTVLVALALLTAVPAVMSQDVDKLKYKKLNKLKIPDVEKITLDNGMRLYLLEDKTLPIFRASLRINCGSYLEPADKVGLASICGTVLRTGGTAKWTGDEIDEELEAIGGSVETSIGLASGSASINVLTEYTDLGLEVLAEILRRPQFSQDKIDLAKVQERSGISRRNDNSQEITFREYRKIIYGEESVFARHSEYATIDAITRDDLVAFHGAFFKPQNVQMAIWGDFDKKDILAKLDKYFGDWKKEGAPVPPLPTVDYKFDNNVFYVNKTDVNQTNIVLGHIGGLTTDEDYADRIVMNNIFGGGFGSRLFNVVRSREGLAYATFGVYTANISYPGVFYGFASTKSETTVKAVKEIVKEIKRMQTEPPTADEMRMGKDGYLNSFVFNFDSKSEVVNRMMSYDFYGLPDDFLFQQKEKVEKVTPEAVMAAANRNLRPDALRILVVGKGEDFDMPLDQMGLGTVTELDVTIPTVDNKRELAITPENIEKGSSILAKAVDAAGGLDSFKRIKSVGQKGTITITTPQGEFPLPVESLDVFPDKSRSIVSMMGQKMYDIQNGTTGWQTTAPGQLTQKSEEDLLKTHKQMARSTIRIFQNADNPDYQAVYDGPGNVEGTDVEFVAFVDNSGDEFCRIGFNPGSFEIVCKAFEGETPMGAGVITELASNFSEIEGVKLPMTLVRMLNGQKAMQIDYAEFVINGEVPANAFEKPEL